jgi:EAL domain-containing protein (putative c-di-GMP-specific phosphodiesterase class I)
VYRKSIAPGIAVFGEGAPADCAYIIERGSVEIAIEREGRLVVLAALGPGEIFGEAALLDDHPRPATATARTELDVLVVPRDAVDESLRGAHPDAYLLVRSLLTRLQAVHERRASPPPAGAMRDEVVRTLTIEGELRSGLDNDEFEPFFQPIVDLDTGEIAGFEALARWRKPDRGLIPPIEFIGVAEQTGLIREIDAMVLTSAWKGLAAAQEAVATKHGRAAKPLFLSINIAAENFVDMQLVTRVRELLGTTGFDPALLKLEITESGLINSPEIAYRVLTELRAMGVSIALDVFGTGYSSLSYLHRFPIDSLKIDRTFVHALASSERSRAIVRTIAGLGQSMSLKVIAEGIEEESTADMLREMGLRYGQGYHYSMPVGRASMAAMLLAGGVVSS